MKKNRTLLALVGIAAASTFILSGCGQASNAATLGDYTVSQAKLQSDVDLLLAERAKVDTSQMQLETGNDLLRSQLRFLVVTHIFGEIAKELKVEISSTEIATKKSDLITSSGGETSLPQNLVSAQISSTNFDAYVKAVLTSSKLAEALGSAGVPQADISAKLTDLVNAKAKQLKITINPRYGKWDQTAGDIVAADSAGTAVTPATK